MIKLDKGQTQFPNRNNAVYVYFQDDPDHKNFADVYKIINIDTLQNIYMVENIQPVANIGVIDGQIVM